MATVGAFLNPFVISPHRPDALALFAYVIAIDVLIVVVARKRWALLDRVAFLGTIAVVGLITPEADFTQRAIFATVLLVIFALPPVIRADDAESPDLMFATAVAYYGYMLRILDDAHPRYRGAFTATLALCYAGLAVLARGRKRLQMGGIAAVLAVLFVPVQFDGPVVPAAWALQGLVLLVLHARGAGGKYSRQAGDIVLAIACAASVAVMIDRYPPSRLLFNPISAAVVIAIACVAISSRLHAPTSQIRAIGAHLLTLIWLSVEAAAAVRTRDHQVLQFTLTGLWAVYAAVLLVFGIQARRQWARLFAVSLFGLVLLKLSFVDLWLLKTGYRIIAFIGIGAILLGCSVVFHRVRDVIVGDDQPTATPDAQQ
jgi:uncharacterized membrane protein